MLIDIIVQMMHGYYAWFKMLEGNLCVLMVWLVMCLCMNKAIAWLVTGPDPDTPPGFPGWSRLVEFHCTIPRECIKGTHLKEI